MLQTRKGSSPVWAALWETVETQTNGTLSRRVSVPARLCDVTPFTIAELSEVRNTPLLKPQNEFSDEQIRSFARSMSSLEGSKPELKEAWVSLMQRTSLT